MSAGQWTVGLGKWGSSAPKPSTLNPLRAPSAHKYTACGMLRAAGQKVEWQVLGSYLRTTPEHMCHKYNDRLRGGITAKTQDLEHGDPRTGAISPLLLNSTSGGEGGNMGAINPKPKPYKTDCAMIQIGIHLPARPEALGPSSKPCTPANPKL